MAILNKAKLWDMSVKEYKNVKSKMLSIAVKKDGGTLLDIGCDDGAFTVRAAKAVGAKKMYGMDIHQPAIKKAKKRGVIVKKVNVNKKFPLPKNFFDVIICNQVVEHLENPDNLFEEMYRTLKDDGYALISTPNLASLHNRLFLLLGWQPTNIAPSTKLVFGNPSRGMDSRMRGPSRHITAFTYKSLKEMLEYYRFKVEKHSGSGFYPLQGEFANIMSRIFPKFSVFSIVRVRKYK